MASWYSPRFHRASAVDNAQETSSGSSALGGGSSEGELPGIERLLDGV
jgi:hypothetical protein